MANRDEETTPTKYVIGPNGIDYKVDGEVRRAEAGDVVDDLPTGSLPWLVKSGAVHVARIILPDSVAAATGTATPITPLVNPDREGLVTLLQCPSRSPQV